MKKRAPTGFRFVQSVGGIEEYTLLKNNLRVLFREDTSAPVGVVMVTYHVGSRNEGVGFTGSTHILEHLLFKGSKRFNAKNGMLLQDVFEGVGGVINATTSFDRTNYFEVVPKDFIGKAVQFEADRMRHATFTEQDKATEMPIVRNEFERSRNDPFELLSEAIWSTAFIAHPYHHPVIGWQSDIENVPLSRLKLFYDTFYWPNNATVTVIGDISCEKALSAIKKEFGVIPPSPHLIPEMYTTEPPQEGERRFTLSRKGGAKALGIAHKMPEGIHKDIPALLLLSNILTEGKSSRLERVLVHPGKAAEVASLVDPLRDPGLFSVYVFLGPKTSHEEVEEDIKKVYRELGSRGVTKAELEKAKTQFRVESAWTRDGVYALAGAINESLALGDWRFFLKVIEDAEKVKTEDIKRVAATYLTDTTAIVGYLIEDNETEK